MYISIPYKRSTTIFSMSTLFGYVRGRGRRRENIVRLTDRNHKNAILDGVFDAKTKNFDLSLASHPGDNTRRRKTWREHKRREETIATALAVIE